MRILRSSYLSAFLFLLAAVNGPLTPVAVASEGTTVTAVSLEQWSGGPRLVITLDEPAPFTLFTLPDPARIVIDTSELGWSKEISANPGPAGLIKQIRHGLFKPGTTRIVLDLSGPAQVNRAEIVRGTGKYRLEIDLKPTSDSEFKASAHKVQASSGVVPDATSPGVNAKAIAANSAMPADHRQTIQPDIAGPNEPDQSARTEAPQATPTKPEPAQTEIAKSEPQRPRAASLGGKSGSGIKTIVIDPGHGGVDPGAIAYNGSYEKVITLAIGQELRRALSQNSNYRVVMTRASDIFIPLGERVNIARKAKADMFISIHADMLQDRSVRGATVYTLSNTASDKEAEQLAVKENKADIIGGIDLGAASADVTTILIDLAQRETMAYSTELAGQVVPALEGNAGLATHGMRSAGFRVLKAPDVPSILIETGYLSNPADVKFLSSKDGQRRISAAVRRAVDNYFSAHQARAN